MGVAGIIFALLAITLILLSGCIQTNNAGETGTAGAQGNSGVGQGRAVLTIKYFDADGNLIVEKSISTPKGVNAWILMKENMNVDYESYGFGPFVKSIEGIAPPAGYYLALYVNGEYAGKGINGYFVNQDTLIEWKQEPIESFPTK